jgi:hypothetical protein
MCGIPTECYWNLTRLIVPLVPQLSVAAEQCTASREEGATCKEEGSLSRLSSVIRAFAFSSFEGKEEEFVLPKQDLSVRIITFENPHADSTPLENLTRETINQSSQRNAPRHPFFSIHFTLESSSHKAHLCDPNRTTSTTPTTRWSSLHLQTLQRWLSTLRGTSWSNFTPRGAAIARYSMHPVRCFLAAIG